MKKLQFNERKLNKARTPINVPYVRKTEHFQYKSLGESVPIAAKNTNAKKKAAR